jgi:hypothetical protein
MMSEALTVRLAAFPPEHVDHIIPLFVLPWVSQVGPEGLNEREKRALAVMLEKAAIQSHDSDETIEEKLTKHYKNFPPNRHVLNAVHMFVHEHAVNGFSTALVNDVLGTNKASLFPIGRSAPQMGQFQAGPLGRIRATDALQKMQAKKS